MKFILFTSIQLYNIIFELLLGINVYQSLLFKIYCIYYYIISLIIALPITKKAYDTCQIYYQTTIYNY